MKLFLEKILFDISVSSNIPQKISEKINDSEGSRNLGITTK